MTSTKHRTPIPPPPLSRQVRPPPPKPAGDVAKAPTMDKTPGLSPRDPKHYAPRIIVHAVEGFGKTTLGAHTRDPCILMARGETGYDTLLSAGRVPAVVADEVLTWRDLVAWLERLINDHRGINTLVLDGLGGFERLCHEHVCARDFNGDWSERGFASYQLPLARLSSCYLARPSRPVTRVLACACRSQMVRIAS